MVRLTCSRTTVVCLTLSAVTPIDEVHIAADGFVEEFEDAMTRMPRGMAARASAKSWTREKFMSWFPIHFQARMCERERPISRQSWQCVDSAPSCSVSRKATLLISQGTRRSRFRSRNHAGRFPGSGVRSIEVLLQVHYRCPSYWIREFASSHLGDRGEPIRLFVQIENGLSIVIPYSDASIF